MHKLTRTFANINHKNQKYGPHPYVFHLDMVVLILTLAGETDQDTINAAYLHDIIEDTAVTHAMLSDCFGSVVANIVKAVSNVDTPKATFINIEQEGTSACKVKIADRIANLIMSMSTNNTRLLNKYVNEDIEFSSHVLKNVQNLRLSESYVALVNMAKKILQNKEGDN